MKIKKKISNFIYTLQRYFKIDFFYLIKGGTWLTFEKIINSIAAFLLSLAWANWVDKSIYGNYQYILSLVAIISVFSLPEMSTAITQAVARGFEGSFVTGFKTKLKWGILTSLSALIIAGYYFWQGNKSLFLSFLIIAVFLPLFNASLIYVGFLSGRKLFSIQVKYNIIVQVIAVIIMGSTLFFVKSFLSGKPIHIILFLIIAVYFLSRGFLYFSFFLITKRKFQPNSKQDSKTIVFGKHLTLSGSIDIVASNLDNMLLFHYLGAIDLAVYIFAKLIPEQIKFFLIKPISTMALPKFSINSREELRRTIPKKIYYLFITITIAVLIYIILAPYIYQVFFSKYLISVSYSRLYALSIIPLSFSIISGVFQAKMMTKQIYQIRIIGPLVKAGLFIILVPLYGIWGAVLGTIFARTFNVFIYLLFLRKI